MSRLLWSNRYLLSAAVVLAAFGLWCRAVSGLRPGACPPTPEAQRPPVAVQRGGLKIAVQSVRRGQGQVRLRYSFEWVEPGEGETPFGFLHPWCYLDILFWDAGGQKMNEDEYVEVFCPAFAVFEAPRHDGEIAFTAPPAARYFAVGSTRAGFLTGKIALPER
jgi:hypothetical protein